MNNKLSNVEYDLKRATDAINNRETEYGVGMINDVISELQDIKKKLGY